MATMLKRSENVKLIDIDDKKVEVIFSADENEQECRLFIDKKPFPFISKKDFNVCKNDNEALKAMVKKLLSDSK